MQLYFYVFLKWFSFRRVQMLWWILCSSMWHYSLLYIFVWGKTYLYHFQNQKTPETLAEESICRLYEVGRTRDDEDDQVCMINSLWPSDAMWRHRSGLTLAQVMAWCLTAPSHYLTQCWRIISEVLWHSPEDNSMEMLKISSLDISLENTDLRSPRHQWFKPIATRWCVYM